MKTILSLFILSVLLPGVKPQAVHSRPNFSNSGRQFYQSEYLSPLNVKQNNSRFRRGSRDVIELTIINHWCGNRLAAFDSVVNGRKVSVRLSYDGSTELYNNGRKVNDGSAVGWWNFFCSSPSSSSHFAREKVIVDGQWTGHYDEGWGLNASKIYFNVQ